MEVVEEHGNPKLGTGTSEELVIANLELLPSGDICFLDYKFPGPTYIVTLSIGS